MNHSDLSIIKANLPLEDLNSADLQDSKLISKEARIQFLTECLSLPSSKEVKQKLQGQLAKETQKLSHLIDQKSLSSEELNNAKNSLFFAKKFLEPNSLEKTQLTHEMPALPAWLKNDGRPLSIKELTLFIGDAYAKTADMEGGQSDRILAIILDYLDTCPDFISKDEWLSLKDLFKKAQSFGQIIFQEKFPDNVKTLKRSLEEALANEKEILLPGGWTSNPHGHALYYKIIRQENGRHTFQIYNRGGGLQYAPSFPQEFKNLYPPFIEITDIKKENLTDEFFLKVFIEQNQFPNNSYSYSEPTNYNERDVFERLLPLLKGKENERNFELEDLMSAQRHGTCAWKGATAVLRDSLGYLPSKQLKLQLEMRLLWSYFRANEKALSKDLVECNALAWDVQAVAKTVQAMQGLISAEEYTQLIGLLAYMENSIDKARSQHIEKLAENTPLIPVTSDELNLPTSMPRNHDLSAYSLTNEIKECSKKSQPSDLLVHLNQWKPNAATLQKDLILFCSICDTAIQNDQYSDVNAFFLQFMRSLPVPTSDLSNIGGKFWQEVIQEHQESITELMQLIAQLSDHFYLSCFNIEGSVACPPARTHAIVKALHIQNILKLHSPLAQLGLTMPSDFTFLEQIFSEGKFRELNFCPTDPLIMQELTYIYHDLKEMEKPFLTNLQMKGREEDHYRIRGLAFEWKNDVARSDKTGTPYFTEINSVQSPHYLNPELAFIQNQLKTDPEYFRKAAEWHKKYKSIEKPDNSSITFDFGFTNNNKKPFHELNIYEQIALIYCEGPEELLPNPFIQWRNQVLQAHLMLYGYFFPVNHGRTITSQKEVRIQLNYSQTYPSMKNEGFFEYIITNKCPVLSDIYSVKYDESDQDESIHWPLPFVNKTIPNRYLPNIRPFTISAIKQICTVWKTHPHLTQNEIYSQTYPEIDMPLQQKRELLTLGTHHDLQVEEAVAYFSKNIHLLKERDYQTLFHMLLFEKDFLVKEIERNPSMITHLENLVQQGYQLAYDSADIETCVYFINLSRHLQNTVAFIYPQKTTHFVPVQQSLCKLLSITGITGHDKSLLYQELTASFAAQKAINKEEIIICIRALICLSMVSIKIEALRPDTFQELRDVLAKFHHIITAALEKDPSRILNEALAPIIEHYSPGDWKETSSDQFESTQGYILNPFIGDFFQKNQPAASLPQKILNDKTYKELFNKNYPAKRTDFRTYEFQDSTGTPYRIIRGSYEYIFQRSINGKWHELKTRALFNKGISNQHHTWVSCDFDRIELFDFSGKHKAYANVDLGKKSNMTDAALNLYQHCKIGNPKRLPDHLVNKELILIDDSQISDSTLKFLTDFEDPTFINAWQDDSGTARLIELPRFDLKLILDTKNSKQPRWICPQIPGYHLAPNQISLPMGMLKGYLVFENKKGEQLIIHPLHLIDSEASDNHSVFSEQISYARSTRNTQHYVTYRLNKGKNGELVLDPTTSVACLYLAYLKLATGRYEEARYLLSLHRLPLRGNCVDEFALLNQIIKLQEINNDDTGPGTALRLHAFYLYLELQERVGNEKPLPSELWKTIYTTCQTYINQMFNTGTFQLPANEERVILHAIVKKYKDEEISPFLINYLKKIDPEFNYDKMVHENSLPLNNEAQKNLYTTVKNICQNSYKGKLLSNDDDIETFTRAYYEINPSWSLQGSILNGIDYLRGIPSEQKLYLITRPGKKGINALLSKWIGAKNKEEALKEINTCLKSSAFDESSSKHLFRAVLEMISRHPKRYTIQVPSELTLRYQEFGGKPRKEWFNQNILPILKDYLRETPEPGPLNIPQKTGTLNPSSNSISIRKKELPTLENLYVNARPESLTIPAKIQPPQKISNFNPVDYPVALSDEQIEQIKTERKESIAQAHAKANKIFSSEKSVNRCTANEYLRLRNDCTKHVEMTLHEIKMHIPKIVPQNKLHELQDNLNLTIQNLQMSLHERKKILEGLVNPSQVDSHGNAKIAASFLTGKREKIGIEKLILLYGRDQINELAKQSSMLSEEDIALVKKLTFDYLVEATYMQQLQRALDKAQGCIKQLNKTSCIDPKQMQKLVNELMASRNEKEKYPACLVLEYWDNILMRPDQMEKMKLFYETGDIQPVVQMIMGAGKTSTLMPLLALLLANGINLMILMLPEEQLQSVFDELKMKLGEGFMQYLFPFVYGRNSDYSLDGLRKLKNKLNNITFDKNCLISTPKSFHCIYLKTIETWSAIRHSHGEKRIELKQQYKLLREIINIFRKKGVVLMDEIHLIQYCRDEVNFPTGKIASINDRDMDMICEIYEGLLGSEAIKPYLKAEFDPNKKNSKAPPYNDQMYHDKIKPVLAKEILGKLKDPNKIFGNKEIKARILEFFNDADEASIYQFLCHDEEGYEKAYDYVSSIKNSDVKNLLFLAQKSLNDLLPCTLQQDCDDEYGVRTKRFATPLEKGKPILSFEKGNLVEGTRYEDPFESSQYTYQAYCKNGIPVQIVEEQIKTLQKQAIDELKAGKDSSNSAAFQEFRDLSGSDRMHLLKLTASDYEKITENIKGRKDLFRLFIKRYIFSTIRFYTRKFNSNAQTLNFLFSRVLGFSGTTPNDTFPDSQTAFPSKGTDARTIFALLGNAGKPIPIDVVDFDHPNNFISQLPFETNELVLIDSGAYLKGETIENEAKTILKQARNKNPSIEGVAYFDDQGKKVILEQGKDQPIPLKDSKIKMEKRFTIYPKPFTTGANTLQADHVIAYFTIGRNLTLSEFLQGVYRMRDVEGTHAIRLCISGEVKQVINAVLGRPPLTPVTMDDVLEFAAANQANEIGDDTYLSLKQKMLTAIVKSICEVVFDEELDPEDAADLFNDAVEEVFAPLIGEDAAQLYGGKETAEDAEIVLDKYISDFKALLEKILASSQLLKAKINKAEVEKSIDAQRKVDIVPEKLTYPQSNSNKLMQAQEQSETQTQTHTHTMQHAHNHGLDDPQKQWRYYDWPLGNIYDSQYYQPGNLMNLKERSWNLDQIGNYVPSPVKTIWGYSANLSKKAWRCLPEFLRDKAALAGESVLTGINLLAFGNAWMYPLKEFLAKDLDLLPLLSLFDDTGLKVSHNFAPKIFIKPTDHIAQPFGEDQKAIRHLLVSRNTENGNWEIMLLDKQEAESFRHKMESNERFMLERHSLDPMNDDLKICLQDLYLGSFQKGFFSPTNDELKSEEYLKLLVQIKFLNGETLYTKAETILMQQWISTDKWAEIKNVYRNRVLAYHPDPNHVIKTLDSLFEQG